jgi:hypothetical protein
MKLRKYIPYMAVIGLLIAAVLSLKSTPEMAVIEAPAVTTSLPDQVGEWRGEDLSYCQNESCMRGMPTSELGDGKVCPSCGGAMVATWSLSEKQLLPADTVLVRKIYRCDSKPALSVSIVISSSEEVSIHRPQMCLTGQGYDIAGEETHSVRLAGNGVLQVRMINLFHRQQAGAGPLVEVPVFYAYWFVSRRHETPSSIWRIFYATRDRVFYGRVSRWAYISITGERVKGVSMPDQTLRAFIRDLYPQIVLKEKP